MPLSGWNENKKLQLTIDGSKIDSDLTNFPVNVTLSSGTGQTGFDATAVFDELTTNSKKIAITDSDDNQLYVEIERWDWAEEEVNLWVKVPTISSVSGTVLYLYYDSAQSDNTTYVGDTGDTPAQNVWDDNFVGVWHMAQDPNGDVASAIKDSTSNINHGTPGGSMTTADLVDGQIGKAIDFDGSDDYINCGSDVELDDLTLMTVESSINLTGWGESSAGRLVMKAASDNSAGWQFIVTSDERLQLLSYWTTSGVAQWYTANTTLSLSTWANVACTYDSTSVSNDPLLYIDGVVKSTTESPSPVGDRSSDAASSLYIGSRAGTDREFYGLIDEVRISKVIRSVAWLKATYYSNWNTLVSFSEASVITFIFSNPTPTDLSTVYGVTKQLYLTTTITGTSPSYTYDADFYNAVDDSLINTSSGIQSAQPAGIIMSTPSGINYQWYVTATSSGYDDTSDTYTFTNKFLCEGQTQVNDVPASGVPVRLYRRSTGEYIGGVISSGVSGTFEIETNYNEYYYAVALYTSDDTNAIIADWLTPSN